MATLGSHHLHHTIPPHSLKMAFYSSDADLALLPDDGMGLYPSSTCQQPPSILYSPPLHQMSHRAPTTMTGSGAMFSPPQDYRPIMESPYPPHTLWSAQPSSLPMTLPQVSAYSYAPFSGITAAPIMAPEANLLPQSYSIPRGSRSHSNASSTGLGLPSNVPSEKSPPVLSRSLSPSSPDLRAYGVPNKNGTWSCAYPGCTSRAVFTRGCDLRKHHKRHTKSFFCRHADCPQSSGGGFSSKKDLARHEAKHNPGVLCEWEDCDRVFSRVDNMVSLTQLTPKEASSLT